MSNIEFTTSINGKLLEHFSSWEHFQNIKHGINDPHSFNNLKGVQKVLKEKLGNIGGIYVYEKNGTVLYVGKAKHLRDRIRSHYRESIEPVPGDTDNRLWHRFFSNPKRCDNINIYYKEINDEIDRQIIEKILFKELDPEFERVRDQERKTKTLIA